MTERVDLPTTEESWRELLGPERFEILRRKGTEPPFTGRYAFSKDRGRYLCGGCGTELFSSGDKFESGTGWPSFTRPVHGQAVEEHEDRSYGGVRTEVTCARCGGHLGHVFDDGPHPTGLRYCINSAALDLEPSDQA